MISSSIDISYNRISGPLPTVFYRMLTDAHGVGRLIVEGNHFHCDGETGEWPEWVTRVGSFAGGNPARYSHTFGVCEPVPAILSAIDAPVDGLLPLVGSGFLPTDELTCRFSSASVAPIIVRALYRSSGAIDCTLDEFPNAAVGVPLEITAAN